MLENRPHLKLKNNATSFSDISQSEQNWASYGVFVKSDDARTMPGCRTPFSFCLCISFKLSPALNLYLQHKLPTNCSSLPKHSPPITGQLSNYMPQLGSNLRLSQLHPLRPNQTDQSQGSELSSDRQTDRQAKWRSGQTVGLCRLKIMKPCIRWWRNTLTLWPSSWIHFLRSMHSII